MTIYEKVWYEMADTKKREFYSVAYLGRQRSIRKFYKILTLACSASGILGWSFFRNPNYGIVTSAIVSAISLLQLIEGHLFHTEEDLITINQLINNYASHFLKCEQIYLQLHASEIEDTEAAKAFYVLCEAYTKTMDSDTKKINITIHEKMREESEYQSQLLLQRYK